jgi:Domain of unknown function (DUF4384)
MLVSLGWVLLAGLQLSSPTSIDRAVDPTAARHSVAAPGRVAVWSDRDDPYHRGDGARVYLSAERPAHVAVFRVDTDGRIRTLFPRDPWGDTYVRRARQFEVTGGRGGRSFVVDDYPGVGYLFAVASTRPFDFGDIARGDYWDYRMIEGGGIRGDPYVALADLAARIAPDGKYDYDISPYYVERHYDYPRFVCYDCHAYAKYDEWDPYRRGCTRFRVVIYDDPRFYPYRSGRGRHAVVARPLRPGPRFVFRDADPGTDYVTRLRGAAAADRRRSESLGRTSRDVGGQGAVPAPSRSSVRPTVRRAPALEAVPAPAPLDDDRAAGRRRIRLPAAEEPPRGLKPAEDNRRRPEPVEDDRRRPEPAEDNRRRPEPSATPRREPQSTGEPELRRRKP